MGAKPDRARGLRVSAALVGLPLFSTLFVKWGLSRDPLSALDMVEAFEHSGWAVMPMLSIAYLAAAFAPMPTAVRRFVVGVAGVASFFVGASLLRSPALLEQSHELRRFAWDPGFSAALGVAILWVAGPGLEIAMHTRPRSRGVSIAAALGWMGTFGTLLLPVGRGAEEGVLSMAMNDHKLQEGHLFLAAFVALLVLAWLQALRRCGKDRERAAARRFKTSWLAYLFMPTPMLVLYGTALFAVSDSASDTLATFHNTWSFVFAAMFGGVLAVAQVAVLLAGFRPPTWVARATGAGLVGALLTVATIALLPDPRRNQADEFLEEMGQAIIAGLRGEAVPERFLGGYEEFDLRSAAASLEGYAEAGAPLELRAMGVHFRVSDGRASPGGWAVWTRDGLRWLGSRESARGRDEVEHLATLDTRLGALLGFAWDGSQSTACLPILEDEGRGTLGSTFLGTGTSEDLCGEGGTPPLFGPEAEPLHGGVDGYRIVVASPDGLLIAFEGTLQFESILWVGRPVPYPIAQPTQLETPMN